MSGGGHAKERAFTVFFMVAVTFVFISLVSGIHLATADVVRRNESLYLRKAIAAAAGMDEAESDAAVLDWYERSVRPVSGVTGDPRYYRIDSEGREGAEAGYVFPRQGAGLWGTIRAVVGMDRSLRRFTGVSFVEHNETPGLGARISEDWFKRQFVGKTGPFVLVDEGTKSEQPTEIDAITGATVTSTAVRDMMNKLVDSAGDIVSAPADEAAGAAAGGAGK